MAARFLASEESKRHRTDGSHQWRRRLIYATRIGSLGAIAGRRCCAGWCHADRLGGMAAVVLRQPRRCLPTFRCWFPEAILERQTRPPTESSRERILAAQPETRAEMVGSYLAKQMARILKVPLASVESR